MHRSSRFVMIFLLWVAAISARSPVLLGVEDKKDGDKNARTYTLRGRCFENADGSHVAGVLVRLYRVEGLAGPPLEIAKTITDQEGNYTFTELEPPRDDHHLESLSYSVFGFAEGRPIGISFLHRLDDNLIVELRMAREKATLSGQVVDASRRPIADANVYPYFAEDRPMTMLPSATTDKEGRFKLDVGVYTWPDGNPVITSFTVRHPDYPDTVGKAARLPAQVVVTMPAGCVITGTVDGLIAGTNNHATITARRTDQWNETHFATDDRGRFRFIVPEGRYDFLVQGKDRVGVALTNRECVAATTIELSGLQLIAGGFIAGQVLNTATRKPVTTSDNGEAIDIGFIGPSRPPANVISPTRLATVDPSGRFVLRAAPGNNFPYFVNIRGDRMAWDTQKQPPVVVKEGETTHYDMLITPEISPEEKQKAARKLVAGLSADPTERTAQILAEFRKLNHTVDEEELWCLLMRELVAIGYHAVPQLCAELDQTTENAMLRRLGFAVRAIGDPRAVPALIRAIPKTLVPSGSDYGLLVSDKELLSFMQTHDLTAGEDGSYFNFGRPVREIIGALHALTKHNFGDADLYSMHLSEDARRQILQRRLFARQAKLWQVWWEANSHQFTKDISYQDCLLEIRDEPLPEPATPGKASRLLGEWKGAVISPPTEQGQHAWHFYDLDTGFRPAWPPDISKAESSRDARKLSYWMSQNGVDLTCVVHRAADGTQTYVLRAFGMKVTEITPREVRNLDRSLAAGKLPEGRPVGELLMHFDEQSQQFVPAANAAFLFVTKEGSMGLIEITDRVTRTANLKGPAGMAPGSVGFHRGVRFNLSAIVP